MRHHIAAIYCAAATTCLASTGAAHISLDAPVSRYYLASSAQADQNKSKAGPCGASGDKRTTNSTLITTFKPGETITVTWRETIQHPGHFRIAFDSDGQDFAFPGATSPAGVTILADDIADKSSASYSQQVTLPNIECSNCTLQLVQIMTTDPPPYATTGDLYFNCADLVLKATGGATSGGATSGGAASGGAATALGGTSAVAGGNSSRGGTGSAGTSVGMAKGGNPGSGGINGSGGVRSLGGAAAFTGGATATGGAPGVGGTQTVGGSGTVGGSTASVGGASSIGGKSPIGGTAPIATSEVYGTGGNASSISSAGGAPSNGGEPSLSGGSVPEVSGAAEDSNREEGCGCRIAAQSPPWAGIGLWGIAMLLLRRRPGRGRS